MNSKDPLDDLLKKWQPPVELPPRFQAEVWQRIADRETESPALALRAWIEQWATILTQPRYATAIVAAVMLLAVGLAQLPNSPDDRMQTRYVNSLDPYTRAHL